MSGAHRQQLIWSETLRSRRGSHAATAVSCAAALLIAFLNPLLCLIHCAVSHQHTAVSSEQQSFLCDLGRSTTSLLSTPFSAIVRVPQAVYPALLVAPPMLVVVIVVLIGLRAPATGVCIHIPLPSFPPPKASPRNPVR